MEMRAWIVVALTLAGGCKKAADPQNVGSGSGSAPKSAPADGAPAVPAVASDAAVAVKPLPAVSGDEQGFLIADTPGGGIDLTGADDKKWGVPDGTIVTRTDEAKGMSEDFTWVKT